MSGDFYMGGTPESQAMYLKYQHLSQQRYRYFKNLVRIAPYAIGAGTAATTAIMGGLRGKRSIDINKDEVSESYSNKQAKFKQDQNQKHTYGQSNAALSRKAGANFLVIKQNGPWNPYPKDNRSLLYKIINPRFSFNQSVNEEAEIITVTGPKRSTYTHTNIVNADINQLKQALSQLMLTSATDPRGSAFLQPSDNTLTSNLDGMSQLVDSEFTIVQFQTKYLVKNKCNFNVNITIWDFVAARDSQANDPTQCYADYLLAQQTLGTSQFINVASQLQPQGSSVSFLKAANVQSVSSFASAYKYTKPFWKMLKKTTMVLEPGGIFEYIQTMYNIKLNNYMGTRFDASGVTCIKGISRSIYMEFQGQMISGPINDQTVITHGDASLLIERFENYTCQNILGVKNNRMVGYTTARGGYFKTLAGNTQQCPNIDGDAALLYDQDAM